MGDITEVVITTKLFKPSLRQHTVERERLYDLLRLGCRLPLTLVVAPAGWGKSTLVAEWLAHDGITAGWVSLDGGDNDPMRFWRYLLLAADQAGSAAGAAALRRLDAAGSDVLRDVLPAFVNALVSADAPLVLVLDDYHLVTSAQVHTSVAMLLDRSPPQLHLILITRADPALPLGRLRVREDLAELRAEDLRFSAAEALEFFSTGWARSCPSETCSGCWRGPKDGPRGCNWRHCNCAAGLTPRHSSSALPALTGTSSTISARRCWPVSPPKSASSCW